MEERLSVDSTALSSPLTTIDTVDRFLSHCQARALVDIYPSIIGFCNGKAKSAWASTFDHTGPGLWRDFFNASRPSRPAIWATMLTTPTASWVGNEVAAVNQAWHAWAVVLTKKTSGNGRRIFIWDCDLKEGVDIENSRPVSYTHLTLPTKRIV